MAAISFIHPKEKIVTGWRGPHDPPGSFFRGEQTYDLYGYWPRVIATQDREENEPRTLPVPVTEEKPSVPLHETSDWNPMLALIQARLLIERSQGNKGNSNMAQLLPYFDSVQNALDTLRRDFLESEELDSWLKKLDLA